MNWWSYITGLSLQLSIPGTVQKTRGEKTGRKYRLQRITPSRAGKRTSFEQGSPVRQAKKVEVFRKRLAGRPELRNVEKNLGGLEGKAAFCEPSVGV